MVVQWLPLSPHSKSVPRLNPGRRISAWSLLRVLPAVRTHAVSWEFQLTVRVTRSHISCWCSYCIILIMLVQDQHFSWPVMLLWSHSFAMWVKDLFVFFKNAFVYIKLSSGTNGKHFKCFLYSFIKCNKYEALFAVSHINSGAVLLAAWDSVSWVLWPADWSKPTTYDDARPSSRATHKSIRFLFRSGRSLFDHLPMNHVLRRAQSLDFIVIV